MYAVQEGIRMAKGDPGAKAYLLTLMDQIETVSILSDDTMIVLPHSSVESLVHS